MRITSKIRSAATCSYGAVGANFHYESADLDEELQNIKEVGLL
ncbi:MAG: hypothetical protein NZ556_08355 [Fimbriimonadales bacterium]|nr:hypothetical protein [Fimbriimonadales bacterium]